MRRILAVLETPKFAASLHSLLARYEVYLCETPTQATEALRRLSPDLILIDMQVAGESGLAMIERWQREEALGNVPFVVFSNSRSLEEKIAAFALGAEDFVDRPFEPMVVRAMLDARLRKRRPLPCSVLPRSVLEVPGYLKLDLDSQRLFSLQGREPREVRIPARHFAILTHLVRGPGQTFSRSQIAQLAWPLGETVQERTVDAKIYELRKALGPLGMHVESVLGVGYRFTVAEAELSPPPRFLSERINSPPS